LNVSVCRVATALELPGTRRNDAVPGNGEDPYFLTTRSVVKLIFGFVTPDFVQGN
jgi:hypothetical protein